MADIGKNLLKLTFALLKHQAKNIFGEEALGVAADTLIDIGGEKAQANLESMLGTQEGASKLLEAAQKADQLFREKCTDQELHEAFTIPMGDLPSVQQSLKDLPESISEEDLLETIRQNLKRDFPKLSEQQIDHGSRLYVDCLSQALLPLEKYTLQIIGQAVLRNEKAVREIGLDIHRIKTLLEEMKASSSFSKQDFDKKLPTQPGSLPSGSNIPFPRNALFTGREDDLNKIAASLLCDNPSTTLISQAITGMGGIGKTQLAVEFAYRHGHQFDGVHWLNLASPESLDSEIAACGRAMGLAFDDQREQVANTLKIWQSGGLRLLILDNFEEVKEANKILAGLQGANMRLLITSRRNDWSKELGLHSLPLNLFSEEESLEFLERSLEKKEGKEERKLLADKLGYLPLALELAAKYINVNKISIAKYLSELNEILSHESMGADWFKSLDIQTPTEHELSLFATFQLSWKEIKDETQQNIFCIAGYCAPNTPIPLEIFTKTLELEEKQINKAIYRLNALGLLNADGLPSIHPLLAAFARSTSKEKDPLEKLAHKLAGLARQANDQVDQTGNLQWFAPFRLHVLSVGEFSEKEKLQDAASLFGNLGNYLRTIADYVSAKFAHERALKIREAMFGSNHENVALSLNNLGSVLQALGDLNGAKINYERALKIDEAAFGPGHPNVATDVNNLGLVLQASGDLNGAKTNYERAIKIWEANLGTEHPQVAIGVNNLGLVLQASGDLNGAKINLERAIKIWEANLGSEHPQVAFGVNNLGGVLNDLGDLNGAKKNYERALKIFKQFLPEGHPNIKMVENNLKTLEE